MRCRLMRSIARRVPVARWVLFAARALNVAARALAFPRAIGHHWLPAATRRHGGRSLGGIWGRAFLARHVCCPPLRAKAPSFAPATHNNTRKAQMFHRPELSPLTRV